jgi:hypothetical protein
VRRIIILLVVLVIAGTGLLAALKLGLWDTLKEIPWVRDVQNEVLAVYGRLTAPTFDTADYTPMPYTGMNPYGINTFLEQEVEEWKVRQSLAMIRDAGFGWIRQEFPWNDIEVLNKDNYTNEYGQHTWDKYDRLVDLVEEYGLEMMVRLDLPPRWAHRTYDQHPLGPPDDYRDYGDYVYSVVSRYRGRVRYYQIWNEPNVSHEWGNRTVSARSYVDLLKIAYTRAKEADPNCVILCAALSPTIDPGPVSQNDLSYLEEMHAAGAKDYFDVMCANPYGMFWGPDERRMGRYDHVNFSRPILTREVMVQHGDATKPIWGMEVGWTVLPEDFPEPPAWGRVTDEQQARYLARGFERAQEEWPWMGPMFVWHFRMVHDVNKYQQQYYFRIVGDKFEPYPAYGALRELATAPPKVYKGYHQEDHWALHWEGDWQTQQDNRAVLRAYREGSDGAALTFTFVGEALELVVRRSPGAGRLRVTVDGSEYIVDLRADAEAWQVVVPVAGSLAYSPHEARVVVEGAGDVDGLIIRVAPDDFRERVVMGALVVGLAIIALLGLGVWATRRRRA